MSRFNLDDYAPVEERIDLFYGEHDNGRIQTELVRLEPPLVVFRAEVFRDAGDDKPWATGYAYEKEGEGHVNRTSYIENCETSAIGRALANAGYHGKRDGAPRPSRQEMEKVRRMDGDDTQPVNKRTGEVKGGGPICPKCGESEMWDNTDDKPSEKYPDYKCKDKDGCGNAIWLDSALDELKKALKKEHDGGLITKEQYEQTVELVEEADLEMLRVTSDWLRNVRAAKTGDDAEESAESEEKQGAMPF